MNDIVLNLKQPRRVAIDRYPVAGLQACHQMQVCYIRGIHYATL